MSFADNMYWNTRVKCKKVGANGIKVKIPDITNLYTPEWEKEGVKSVSRDAPFLFRNVKGDFEVSVKISGKFENVMDQAGILISEKKRAGGGSRRVYMRCGIEADHKPSATVVSQDENNSATGKFITTAVIKKDNDSIDKSVVPISTSSAAKQKQRKKTTSYWFSIERRGDVLIACYSDDGELYRPVRVATFSNREVLAVGIYGACPLGNNGFHIVYEDFIIEEPQYEEEEDSLDGYTILSKQTQKQKDHLTRHQTQEEEENAQIEFEFDIDLDETSISDDEDDLPFVGAGFSDELSVMSEMTTPTVVTGVPVPNEELYNELRLSNKPGMQMISFANAPTKVKNRVDKVRTSALHAIDESK